MATCTRNITQYLPDNSEGLDDAGTRAVEELITVGEVYTPVFHGIQALEIGALGQPVHFASDPGKTEAAGSDDDDVGIRREKLVPRDPWRMDARLAEDV